MKAVVLSKIATKISDDEYNAQQNFRKFRYKQKTWQFLPDVFTENDCSMLLETMELCEIGKFKVVDFIEQSDELIVLYKNNVHMKRRNHGVCTLNIFKALFGPINNTNRHVEEAMENKDRNRILKTYVTTELFKALQRQHALVSDVDQQITLSLPDKFLPTLCNYQKKSVQWLLAKERMPSTFSQYYEKLRAKDNETVVYKHLHMDYVQDIHPQDLYMPPGGILADEMGLGKTVEILALILLNPLTAVTLNPRLELIFQTAIAKRICLDLEVFCICTSKSQRKIIQCIKCSLWQHSKCVAKYNDDHDVEVNEPYMCPSCWQIVIEECGILKSKGTFIVSPNTIKMQWLSEIRQHIQPSLRVLIYDGVVTGKWLSPRQLSNYDVVLTDYNVLRREIYYTSENVSERSTRNKPRSIRIHTPILMLEWWRVCLDEAQMVESNTSNVAALVRMIPAINRWAVSGTPIQRSLNDLQPLLQFVGFDVVAEVKTWNYLVNNFLLQYESCSEENTSELINVLQKCMWRTCKWQIANELQIPPQSQKVHTIQFENLEKLFYNEQHAECKANFIGNVQKYTSRLSTISPQIMKLILQPFLKIRQSCTMPVVVINGPTISQQKQFLQPGELHAYLKSSNETSCKSELRAMASSHNGLAALYFIKEKYDEASKHYDTVLKLAKEYNHMNLTVDSLLQIHALHNLMQIRITQNGINSNLPIPCLEPYESHSNSLEWKYLSTYSNTLSTVMAAYQVSINKINCDSGDNFLDSIAEALDSIKTSDTTLLLQKIHEECMSRFGIAHTTKLAEVQSTHSLLYILDLWFSKLDKIFNTLKCEIENLKYFIDNIKSRNQVKPDKWRKIMELVNSVYDCHLSEIRENEKGKKDKPAERTKIKCKMCSIQDFINSFECLLFDKVIDENTNFTEGLENPSFEMYLCKTTISFLKNQHLEQNILYLESLQIYCKRLIKLWIEMEFTIKAYDELNMCKMRISLTEDPDDKSIYKIFKHEIRQRIMDQQNELITAQRQFTIKLARLKYIKHLESDEEMGPCPICHLLEEERYAVLECGHHICFQCLKSLQQYSRGAYFKCSICRNTQQHQNLYYVSRSKSKKNENHLVKGNYSTKITYIVGLILQLLNKDNGSDEFVCNAETGEKQNIKLLIFSQWAPILQAISAALEENDITFRTQCTPKAFEEFKNPNLGITCLLMPFRKGSKGLNLVEATHVFLVEPNLIIGEELQAIGRVHRFGQTKPTTVHRFIMSDSIEENIYNFISSATSSADSSNGVAKSEFENVSLDDLKKLFELKTSKDYE